MSVAVGVSPRLIFNKIKSPRRGEMFFKNYVALTGPSEGLKALQPTISIVGDGY